MKNIALISMVVAATGIISCENDKSRELANQAIEIHDEIMPKISQFDQKSLVIDSILNDGAALRNISEDTVAARTALEQQQQHISAATDKMMIWMEEYNKDSTDVAYQQGQLEVMKNMKAEFEKVDSESSEQLGKGL